MRERTDDSLLLATARGDEAAFAELVARHRPRLVRYATSRCGRDVGLAEDAVQDGLVRAHRAIVGGKVPVDVEAWLYAIVRNRCHDYFRAAKPTAPLPPELPGGAPSAFDVVEQEGVVGALSHQEMDDAAGWKLRCDYRTIRTRRVALRALPADRPRARRCAPWPGARGRSSDRLIERRGGPGELSARQCAAPAAQHGLRRARLQHPRRGPVRAARDEHPPPLGSPCTARRSARGGWRAPVRSACWRAAARRQGEHRRRAWSGAAATTPAGSRPRRAHRHAPLLAKR